MHRCSQCGNNALYELSGNPLCLNCYHKVKQIEYLDYIKHASAVNQANEQMDDLMASYGVPSNSPKYKIPSFPQFFSQAAPMTLQYINVSNSAIGSLNTGNVKQIDVAMSNFMNDGQADLAATLKEFTEAVIQEPTLNEKKKDEMLEHLAFLSTQAVTLEGKKQKSVAKSILSVVRDSLGGAAALVTIWGKLEPLIRSLL